jgi:hypothetical protein
LKKLVLFSLLIVSFDIASARLQGIDILQQIEKGFPKSITFKKSGRLIEFCPDNTCDAFLAAKNVNKSDLKEFAYLWIYAFSDFTYLEDWRSKAATKRIADRILAEPRFESCSEDNPRDRTKCAVTLLSKGGRIRLFFIRYDEGARAVSEFDIAEELAKP